MTTASNQREASSATDPFQDDEDARLEQMLIEAERLAIQMRSISRDSSSNGSSSNITGASVPRSIEMLENATECSSVGIGHGVEQLKWSPSSSCAKKDGRRETIAESSSEGSSEAGISKAEDPTDSKFDGNNKDIPKRTIEDILKESKSSVRVDDSIYFANGTMRTYTDSQTSWANRIGTRMQQNVDAQSCTASIGTMFHSVIEEEKICEEDPDNLNIRPPEIEETSHTSRDPSLVGEEADMKDSFPEKLVDTVESVKSCEEMKFALQQLTAFERDFDENSQTSSAWGQASPVPQPPPPPGIMKQTAPAMIDDNDQASIADYCHTAGKRLSMSSIRNNENGSIKWEKVSSAAAGDDDYVSVRDYSSALNDENPTISEFWEGGNLSCKVHRAALRRRRKRKRRRIVIATMILVIAASSFYSEYFNTFVTNILSKFSSRSAGTYVEVQEQSVDVETPGLLPEDSAIPMQSVVDFAEESCSGNEYEVSPNEFGKTPETETHDLLFDEGEHGALQSELNDEQRDVDLVEKDKPDCTKLLASIFTKSCRSSRKKRTKSDTRVRVDSYISLLE